MLFITSIPASLIKNGFFPFFNIFFHLFLQISPVRLTGLLAFNKIIIKKNVLGKYREFGDKDD